MDIGEAVDRAVDDVFVARFLEPNAVLTREPASDVHGPVVTVSSDDGQSAEVQVHVESDRQLDIRLGQATRFELYVRTPDRLMTEFRKIIEAVALRGMQEVVRTDAHGLIVSSQARLEIGDKPKTYRWRGGLFGRGVNATSYDYLPYQRKSDRVAGDDGA